MRSQKTIFLFVLLLFGLIRLGAQSEADWQWTTQAGGEGNEQGISIAVDNQGNQYVTGSFTGSAVFGTTTLTSSGSSDIFICKLDTDGNFLWAMQAGGTDTDTGYSIGVDSAGNSYVTGQFYGTANFGNTSFTSDGYGDIFVCKLDTDGNFLWAKQANGTSHDLGRSIAVDNEGNQYVTGRFMDSASFGATTLTSIGSSDIFVCKLDTNGNFLWARQAGGTASDIGNSIGVDSNSNSFVTGWFIGNASFGDITLNSIGITDNFICKLDAAGNFLWANQTEGESSLVAVDSSGNSYMSGWFRDSVSFGEITLIGNGGIDIFICKLDTTGNYLWANMAGGTYYGWGEVVSDAIAVDNSGNSYMTGHFYYTAAFGNTTLTSSGEVDIFICKLDPDGNFIWAKQAGGADYDWGRAVAVDSSGNCYVTGYFQGCASFGAISLTSIGGYDIFVAKISSSTLLDDSTVPELAANSLLYPVWPNPCLRGQSVSIKAVVGERETGVLSVYNLRGELISRRELASGEHVVSQDSRELPSGLYFYRLVTPKAVLVRKLAIIK